MYKKIPLYLLLISLIFLYGCSSDSGEEAPETEAPENTVSAGFIGSCQFWYYSDWDAEKYDSQFILKNGGDNIIEFTNDANNTMTPEEDAQRRIQKIRDMGNDVEVTEDSEWNNDNTTGHIIKMKITNKETGKESDSTEIFLNNGNAYRISFRDYGDGTITQNDFETILKDVNFNN